MLDEPARGRLGLAPRGDHRKAARGTRERQHAADVLAPALLGAPRAVGVHAGFVELMAAGAIEDEAPLRVVVGERPEPPRARMQEYRVARRLQSQVRMRAGLAGRQRDRARQSRHLVLPLHFHAVLGILGDGGSDPDLELFGGHLADHDPVLAADVIDNGFIQIHAAGAQGLRRDDAIHRHDRGLRTASAQADHHVAGG